MSQGQIKLKKVDWHGFVHEKVAEQFGGDLVFVNYINVGEKGDLVAAVYQARKPDRSKGHKEFMLLWKKYDTIAKQSEWFVSGMEREEIEKHAHVVGLACLECKTALYSLDRHHFHRCGCANDLFVDGGKDYVHAGAKSLAKTSPVRINLLTDEIVVDEKAPLE